MTTPTTCSPKELATRVYHAFYRTQQPPAFIEGVIGFFDTSRESDGTRVITREYEFLGYRAQEKNCRYEPPEDKDETIAGDVLSSWAYFLDRRLFEVEVQNTAGNTPNQRTVRIRKTILGKDKIE